MGASLMERRTSVGPWQIHGLTPGQPTPAGVPLVLVHGFGVSGSYWKPLADRLARLRPVYVPDLPGHGLSSKPRGGLDVGELGEALGGWLDALGITRATLIGNSLGCQIVARVATRRPGLAERIVLAGPTVDPRGRSAAAQMARLLLSAPAEHPALALLLARDYARAGVRRLRAELGHMLRDRIEERLPEIAAPALVLRGTMDRVVPRRWAEEVSRLLPSGRLVEIPWAGHAAHYSRAKRVAAVVRRFLEG